MIDKTLDGERIFPTTLTCDMVAGCPLPVTHIDNKGYIYCTKHGVERRRVGPCRKLRNYELTRLKAGKALTRY